MDPKCKAKYCDPGSDARQVLDLLYLKPKQYQLLHNPSNKKIFVIGPAGAGKTVVTILKIVSLVQSGTKYNILSIAPAPHHLRLKKLLERNGVKDVYLEEDRPLKPLDRDPGRSQPVVRVVQLRKKDVKDGRLFSDAHSYMEHVFIDDIQNEIKHEVVEPFSLSVKKLSEHLPPDVYLWIAGDRAQGYIYIYRDAFDKGGVLPRFYLTEVLRNTKPIIEIMKVQYLERRGIDDDQTNTMPTMNTAGHTINGPSVDIYVQVDDGVIGDDVAEEYVSSDDDDDEVSDKYLKITFETILTEWQNTPTAVICDHETRSLCVHVLNDLGVNTITIEEYIEQDEVLKTDQIITDVQSNVASFEIPLVIMVTYHLMSSYNFRLTSRARSKLVMVCSKVKSREHVENLKHKYPTTRFFVTQ